MPRTSTAKERLTEAALRMIWCNSYGATSVDAICAQAKVKKGSFYYFFRSKSDLAAAALDADWREHKAQLDGIFSPSLPPLERLRRYFEFNYQRLAEIKGVRIRARLPALYPRKRDVHAGHGSRRQNPGDS